MTGNKHVRNQSLLISIIVFSIFILALTLAISFCSQSPVYSEGHTLQEQSNRQEASQRLDPPDKDSPPAAHVQKQDQESADSDPDRTEPQVPQSVFSHDLFPIQSEASGLPAHEYPPFQRFLGREQSDPRWDALVCEAFRLQGIEEDTVKARTKWEEAYDLGCRDASLLYNLADCCQKTGAPNRSKEYLLELLQVTPKPTTEMAALRKEDSSLDRITAYEMVAIYAQAHLKLSYAFESEGDLEQAQYHAREAGEPYRTGEIHEMLEHAESIARLAQQYHQHPDADLAVNISRQICHVPTTWRVEWPLGELYLNSSTLGLQKFVARKGLGTTASWLDKAIECAPARFDILSERVKLCQDEADYVRGESLIPLLLDAANKSGDKVTQFWSYRTALRLLWEHAYDNPTASVLEARVEPIRKYVGICTNLAREIGDDESMYLAHWIVAQNYWSWSGKNQCGNAAKELEKAYTVAKKNGWRERTQRTALRILYMYELVKDEENIAIWQRISGQQETRYARLKVKTRAQAERLYDYYRETVNRVEREMAAGLSERQMRDNAKAERFKKSFFPYIACCLLKGLDEEAFIAAERAYAFSFSALMGNQAREGRNKVVASQRVKLEHHKDHVTTLEKRLASLTGREDADQLTSLQRDLVLEGQLVEQLNHRIALADDELMTLSSGDTLSLREIQGLLGDATLIEYCGYHGDQAEKSFIAVVTAESFTVIDEVDLYMRDLERLSAEFTAGVDASATMASADAHWEETCRRIYDIAFKPVRSHVKTKEIIIVPYGALNLIPFGCLKDENGMYLAEKYAISYVPSGSVLKFIQAKRKPLMKNVLILANPLLASPGASLRFAEMEAESVAKTFPQSNILMGAKATETALLNLASGYDVLHLACHGMINQNVSRLSNLRLAGDEENDGLLHVGEIFNLNLDANLITLSACNTGVSELAGNGFDFMGMTRAFLFAGTPSVLASLWRVDDRATSELMELFYKNLLNGQTKSKALQNAQRTLMKKYQNPYYWGAFVLHGDYR